MARADIETIRNGLRARIRQLADELAPSQPRIEGHRRWSLNPVRADRHANSFCIDISGSTAGRWTEFNGDVSGDAIGLIAYCLFSHLGRHDDGKGEAVKAAIQWAENWLGLSNPDPAIRAKAAEGARLARARAAREAASEERKRAWKARQARAAWYAAEADCWRADCIARRYLEEVRGLLLSDLPWHPKALRFEPDGPGFDGAPHDPDTGEVYPAIVSCMVAADSKIKAVHRTYLTPDGRNKAPMPKPKLIYGAAKGSAIFLTRGRHGCSIREAEKRGLKETLAVSEGIEDGLSWACMERDHRVWAAGSASFLASIPVPPSASEIVLIGQNNKHKTGLEDSFKDAAAALHGRTGLPVRIERPRDPAVKDMNDLWRKI